MADGHSFIHFDGDHRIEVQEPPDRVVNEIGGVTTPHVPILELTDPAGNKVLVNANQIRVITDR